MSNGGGAFNIEVKFVDGLTAGQKKAFRDAAERWGRIIDSDIPTFEVDRDTFATALDEADIVLPPAVIQDLRVDDLLIFAKHVSNSDGPDGDLGGATPLLRRPDSLLPAVGVMEFDPEDLPILEQEGNLAGVVLHEMCHVLGFGRAWPEMRLIEGEGTDDPVFVGEHAMTEYAALRGSTERVPVPLENVGPLGGGRRDGHWREAVFGNEIMTPIRDLSAPNPVSRMTIAALKDMGYDVKLDAAEPFELPSA